MHFSIIFQSEHDDAVANTYVTPMPASGGEQTAMVTNGWEGGKR